MTIGKTRENIFSFGVDWLQLKLISRGKGSNGSQGAAINRNSIAYEPKRDKHFQKIIKLRQLRKVIGL